MKKKTIRRVEMFLHFITVLLLLLKGYDLISRKLYYPGIIITGLAITVFIILTFWRYLKIKPKQARIAC